MIAAIVIIVVLLMVIVFLAISRADCKKKNKIHMKTIQDLSHDLNVVQTEYDGLQERHNNVSQCLIKEQKKSESLKHKTVDLIARINDIFKDLDEYIKENGDN